MNDDDESKPSHFPEKVEEAHAGPDTMDECPACEGTGMLPPGAAMRLKAKLERCAGEGKCTVQLPCDYCRHAENRHSGCPAHPKCCSAYGCDCTNYAGPG